MKTDKHGRYRTYCDSCDEMITLDSQGYCGQCGKHYDNMPAGKARDTKTIITMEDRSKWADLDPYGEIY